MSGKVLVAGATDGVGKEVLRQLVAQGAPVRALAHDAAMGRTAPDDVEVVAADLENTWTLLDALAGCDSMVIALGVMQPNAVRNLAAAAKMANLRHVVLVSPVFVDSDGQPLPEQGAVLEWKTYAEGAVRGNSVPYTIVRSGALTSGPGDEKALAFMQGEIVPGYVAVEDLARVCVQALDQPAAERVTLQVVEADGPPPTDWPGLFGALTPDDTTRQ